MLVKGEARQAGLGLGVDGVVFGHGMRASIKA